MRYDFHLRTKLPNCGLCGLPIRNNAEVEINGKLYHPTHIPKESYASTQRLTEQKPAA